MRRGALCVAWLALTSASSASAATPLERVRISPDTTAVLDASTLDDEGVAEDDLAGTVTPVPLPSIPAGGDLDAYARLANGDQLLSFDTTVTLPGPLTAEPCDVVRWDGTACTFAFQGRPVGIPPGVNLDAVAVRGTSLLLSFDVAVDFGNFRADDADLVLFDGIGFSLFFDAAASGVDPALDLDAADYLECNDHLLLSFDGNGSLGAVSFGDMDVLELGGPPGFELAYHPDWGSADLDALAADVDLGPGPATVFPQTLLAGADKISFGWTSSLNFRGVRGPLGSVGSYAADIVFGATGTTVHDDSLPASGTGFWYLVKQGGCTRTSWQSALGVEPGRDAALP